MHRALLVADVIGLGLAFLLAQLLFKPVSTPHIVSPAVEVLVFALTLPLWVIMAQLSGLYGRDGDRADHSTVDDVVPCRRRSSRSGCGCSRSSSTSRTSSDRRRNGWPRFG